MLTGETKATIAYYSQEILAAKMTKAIGAFLLSGTSFVFGDFGLEVVALFALMVMDFSLGFLVAFTKREIESSEMRKGIFKFMLFGAAISVGQLLDVIMLSNGIGEMLANRVISFRTLIVAYLAINEAISILEHLGYFGVPLPKGVLLRLKRGRSVLDKTY